MWEVVEKTEMGLEEAEIEDNKCNPARIVDPPQDEWRQGLDSMPKRWAALLKNNLKRFPHDVTFCVGGEEITCHKFVMSMASPFFEALIENKAEDQIIELPGVDLTAFKNVIQHVYQDKSSRIEEKNLLATMSTAILCQIPELQKQCSKRIQEILSTTNAVTIFQEADKIKDAPLRKKAHTFILQHFEDILDADDFLSFTEKNLSEFLKSDYLFIFSEIGLFRGVIRWAVNKCESIGKEKTVFNLKELLGGILCHIRISAISSEEFVSVLEPSGLFDLEDIVTLFKYFWQRKQNKYTDGQLKKLKFSTSLRRCKLQDIVVRILRRSSYLPRTTKQHEWSQVNYYNQCRFRIDGSDKNPPIFLKGIGFPGREDYATEDVIMCVKITTASDQNEILSEKQINYTAKANQIFMVDLINTVRIVPNTEYCVLFNNINGGLAEWTYPISQVVLFKNPCNSSKSINLTVTSSCKIVHSLNFSHVECSHV